MREDWIDCSLGDLFILIKNGSNIKQTENINGIPVSRIETIWNESIDWNRVKYALDFDEIKHSQYLLIENDILFSHINSDSHLGKTAIFREKNKKLIHGINLLLMRPHSDLVGIFLLYFLRYHKYSGGFLDIAQRSVNQSSINQTALKKVALSIPSKHEQRAIIKKLESLFSSLDAGVGDLKKAQQQLKIYRQSVLKKAFEGGNEVKLSSCCIKADKVNRRDIELVSSLKYIDIGSIDNKLNKIIGFKEYLWKDAPSRAQQIIKKGDILFSTVRTYLRNIAQVESDIYENEICSSGFTVLRADDTKLLNKYLFHFTLYNGFLDKLGELQTGTSYPAVRDKDVFDQSIPLHSVEEQKEIVKQIESRLSVCDSIEQNIKESLVKAEALRQSILKKAFEGRLLSEAEVTACKQAPDYEPASVLLERIKKENKKK